MFVKFEPVQIPCPILKLNLRNCIAFLASLTLFKLKIYSNKGALTKKRETINCVKRISKLIDKNVRWLNRLCGGFETLNETKGKRIAFLVSMTKIYL